MKSRKTQQLLMSRAGEALLEQLPVDQKHLRRAAKLMEPKNLKRLGILTAGGMLSLSLLGDIGQMRLYRTAMAKELRRQLAPVNKKLETLEKQNEELRLQNEELRKQLTR